MYDISDKFAEIMMSNIRPKCEPKITATKTNSDGTQTVIEWKAKDIKDFTFKHEIDPVGRTLPYIELTWTEIYKEKEDFEEIKKYLSTSKFMVVNLSVTQNLGFYNNWKSLKESGVTWKELLNRGVTWKQLKNQVNTETITFPTLFLEDKPVVENMTIKWTARDFLYFLNQSVKKTISVGESGIWFFQPFLDVLEESKSYFEENIDILNYINSSQTNIQRYGEIGSFLNEKLTKPIYVSSDVRNFLKNYASLKNLMLVFSENGLNLDYLFNWTPKIHKTSFMKKTLFSKPKKTKNITAGRYYFKFHEFDENNNWVEVDDSVPVAYVGEDFIEDNPLNPYGRYENEIENRAGLINRYFDEEKLTLEFESLPHFEFQSGDVVQIESDVLDYAGNPKTHFAVIVLSELKYSGSYKQKNIAHEIQTLY